jgi:hypothetical protein
MHGQLGLSIYDHGVLVRRQVKRNQITNQARSAVLHQLYLGTTSDAQEQNKIWSLALGINNTLPMVTDDVLTMDIAWQDRLNTSECYIVENTPNEFYIQVIKMLPMSEANGYSLTEAGIITRGNNDDPVLASGRKLYARQVFVPVVKSASMSIQIDWQLGLTIQGV